MAQPFIGEIRMFAGDFAPAGWAFCDGSLQSIDENDTLFNLIGTTYGGDGQTTFALPDLQGRVPLHMGTSPSTGSSYVIGQLSGVETVNISIQQMPQHTHPHLASSNPASGAAPANLIAGTSSGATITEFGSDVPLTALAPQAVTSVGGSQPHSNIQPCACLSFIISLFGVYPSPT